MPQAQVRGCPEASGLGPFAAQGSRHGASEIAVMLVEMLIAYGVQQGREAS